jgi:hypothetical protein
MSAYSNDDDIGAEWREAVILLKARAKGIEPLIFEVDNSMADLADRVLVSVSPTLIAGWFTTKVYHSR